MTLIPAAASVDFIHLVAASFDNGLYGFHGAMNNEEILPPIKFVVSRYFVKQYTGHISLFKGNVGILLLQYGACGFYGIFYSVDNIIFFECDAPHIRSNYNYLLAVHRELIIQ